MIRHHRPVLSSIIAICVFIGSGIFSQVSAFQWDAVKYKGNDYVTLRKVKEFYYFNKISFGKNVTLENKAVEMKFRTGSQECRMNGVLFILSNPIVAFKGKYLLSRTDLVYLVDPILRPNHIKKARKVKTVIVDAGHGGKDSGSKGHRLDEKHYTLKVARYLRTMLQAKGYQVVMTRNSDVFISLGNRVRIANKYPDAVFLSIHFNSGNPRANGIETFTISPLGVPHMGRGVRPRDFRPVPGNTMGSSSIALATAAHSRARMFLERNNFRIADRGIKRARFNVLTGIKIPAILLEGGFLSNRAEAEKVHSVAYQKMLAMALVRSVEIYNDSISKPKAKK